MGSQTFAKTPEVMSYVLQQKRHTYINYDVNRLVNVWVLNSDKRAPQNARCDER